MQSGFDISHLAREAQTRWLKPVEVFFILQNYEEHQLTHQIPQQPTSGSLYLFNKRVLKSFRKDGHKWRRRKDQRNIAEAHERLKVGNVDALNCYYAHGEENPNFQRRSYWMLDRAYEHIVLVHYRDIAEGSQNARSRSQFSRLSSSTFSPSPNSFITQQPNSSLVVGESYYLYNNQSSPSSVEINSNEVTKDHGMNQLDYKERTNEVNNSSVPDLSQALCRIEQQLSLNDNDEKEIHTFYIEHDDSNVLEDMLRDYQFSNEAPNDSENLLSQSSEHWKKHHQIPGPQVDSNEAPNDSENRLSQSSEHWKKHHQIPGPEIDIWKEMLDSSKTLPNVVSGAQFGRPDSQKSELMILQELDSMKYPGYSSMPTVYGSTPDCDLSLLDQDELGIPLENSISLTVSQKQKFTIQDISPEWCYTFEGAKIIIIGYFLCDPSECAWACMFGDTEVPVEIIQQGVIRCHAPPHLQGKVTLCITSGNRESCSEVKEFEYRDNPCVTSHSNPSENEASKSSEELLLLARFVQMLLSDLLPEGDASESSVNLLGGSRSSEDPWSQIIDALLVGSSTSSKALDWLLQELLKDRLQLWVSSRLESNNCKGYCLSKKEQSIIHMVAGLGYEWALQPILNTGLNVNFRDINGWTALHWAARFGREKMVAALIASGASAGAVTDPNSQDPMGKTPASIAATCGHKGLAGYLSEVALTSHLSSLTLEVSELSKGSAAVEAERTVNSVSNQSSSRYDDQVSLEHALAAVRTAAQAATRIQSAFRAHSFRKRQQREAAVAISGASGDEYCILANDIQGLPQLTFRSNSRDYNSAALSIQKKYRGWKDRKYFLSLRQKVVKIQAHVRGYQVRKYYKVCWAVSILEKAVLRWRRKGVGLRGFRHDSESVDESDSDEDILTVFRKQKVDAALDEAVSRVLSMVESPEARQQYSRLLEKYRQAKAELGSSES